VRCYTGSSSIWPGSRCSSSSSMSGLGHALGTTTGAAAVAADALLPRIPEGSTWLTALLGSVFPHTCRCPCSQLSRHAPCPGLLAFFGHGCCCMCMLLLQELCMLLCTPRVGPPLRGGTSLVRIFALSPWICQWTTWSPLDVPLDLPRWRLEPAMKSGSC
jgi:hypothetical protein